MRMFAKSLLAAGLLVTAAFAVVSYGTDGSLTAVDGALAGAVGTGNASAIKMQGFVRKESKALSQDFVTFSKVVKEAEKGNYEVLSETFLADHFATMAETSALYGAAAFTNLSNAAGGDPKKIVKIFKANAKYIVKQSKILGKYNEVWGNPTDMNKVDLAKASLYYAQVQKLYEIINSLALKYGG